MDYLDLMASALQGAHIRLKRSGLPYDRDAIKYLYAKEGAPTPDFNSPFCTDGDVGSYQDCLQFDTFSNPTAWHTYTMGNFIKTRPISIMYSYQQAMEQITDMVSNGKKVDPVKYVQQIPLDPRGDALHLSIMWEELLESVSNRARFIQVVNRFHSVSTMNREEYLDETYGFVQQNMEELGSLSQIIFDHLTPMDSADGPGPHPYSSTMEQVFDKLIHNLESRPQSQLVFPMGNLLAKNTDNNKPFQ